MSGARKEWAGAATSTTLTSSMSAGAPTSGQTFTVAAGAGYPTGVYSGGFVVTVDLATANEEKILCSARSGNTYTVATGGRGWDGTTAQSHGGGITAGTINHTLDGDTLTDVSGHVYDTTRDDHTQYQKSALLTTQGDIPYATAASTWARLAKGTGWQSLAMNNGATAPAYASAFPAFVFADATARDAAVTTPIKGMAAWLTGTGTIARTVYDGTAWRVWEVWGTGAPESAITATVGAMYHRTDGGASTSLYVKESGTGNTGWIAYGAATATGPKELGYTDVTAAQTAIGTSTTDLTSLTVTVTCDGTTPIMITGYVPYFTKNTAAGYAQLFIYESTTELVNAVEDAASGGLCQPGPVMRRITPSAGSHTYKLRANAGNNTVDMFAAATERAFIRVEEVKT